MDHDVDVAVVGGGLGGLTLAIGLLVAGVSVDVFEQADDLRARSARASRWPPTPPGCSTGWVSAPSRRATHHRMSTSDAGTTAR
jgi:2-polyprenyl-6-methoxyphenol hydroxylase-like FAD-dependent oxidoreductase